MVAADAKSYPQREIALAWRISFSTRSATSSLPYSHALALSSSYFGRWPNWATDLNRLNTSSTCQRIRYHSRMSAGLKAAAGMVVKTITYSAHVSVSGCACLPLRAASLRTLRSASLMAAADLRRAHTRPARTLPERALSSLTTT